MNAPHFSCMNTEFSNFRRDYWNSLCNSKSILRLSWWILWLFLVPGSCLCKHWSELIITIHCTSYFVQYMYSILSAIMDSILSVGYLIDCLIWEWKKKNTGAKSNEKCIQFKRRIHGIRNMKALSSSQTWFHSIGLWWFIIHNSHSCSNEILCISPFHLAFLSPSFFFRSFFSWSWWNENCFISLFLVTRCHRS